MKAEQHLRPIVPEYVQDTRGITLTQLAFADRDPSLQLLVGELQHRIRNILSIVQCFVTNTEAETADDYRMAVKARIDSLSSAYDLIEVQQKHRISLAALLERTLRPHATRPYAPMVLAGPDVVLEPRCALSLHLVFHELATNASKHGALSSVTGTVEVHWEIVAEPTRLALAIEWRERGGPRVAKPQRKGFGMRMIAKALSEARVDVDFAPTGLVVRFLIENESWSLE